LLDVYHITSLIESLPVMAANFSFPVRPATHQINVFCVARNPDQILRSAILIPSGSDRIRSREMNSNGWRDLLHDKLCGRLHEFGPDILRVSKNRDLLLRLHSPRTDQRHEQQVTELHR
jgi:hypothetical protein